MNCFIQLLVVDTMTHSFTYKPQPQQTLLIDVFTLHYNIIYIVY